MRVVSVASLATNFVLIATILGGTSAAAEEPSYDLTQHLVDRNLSKTRDSPQDIGQASIETSSDGCESNSECLVIEDIEMEDPPLPQGFRLDDAEMDDFIDFPEGCRNQAEEVWRALDRTHACMRDSRSVTVFEPVNGVLVATGRMDYVIWHFVYTSASNEIWAHQIQMIPTSIVRSARDIIVTGESFCWVDTGSSVCGISEQYFSPYSVAVQVAKGGEAYQTSSPNTLTSGTGEWEITFKTPTSSSATISSETPTIRCDRDTKKPILGCVIPSFTPTLTYSRSSSKITRFAQHLDAAQNSGLPGRTRPLTYLQSLAARELNAKIACPTSSSWLKRPSGHSCDEYPFRSTWEGAMFMGINNGNPSVASAMGRTHSWCQVAAPSTWTTPTGPVGWSICMIPEGQNSSAGGTLSAFYKANRMADRDPFFVKTGP